MKKRTFSLIGTGAAGLLLAACGGGGGGMSSGGTASAPPPAVNTAPTVSNLPPDQSVLQDSVSDPVTFTVADKETSASKLQITAQSSNADVIDGDGISFGGDGGSRTLILRPKAGAAGDATVTVGVKDAGGMSGTQTFALHVTSAEADYTQFVNSSLQAPATADPAETLGKTWTNTSSDNPDAFDSLFAQ